MYNREKEMYNALVQEEDQQDFEESGFCCEVEDLNDSGEDEREVELFEDHLFVGKDTIVESQNKNNGNMSVGSNRKVVPLAIETRSRKLGKVVEQLVVQKDKWTTVESKKTN
ncbi:hypothetical protein FRX31_001987 [Thalictrum thalictroides]|uniref:Uncharacterized protein n=1 Tax=Thalictrum thalictroides TaxID=46969 RepID=A0A7J6XI25_THATH|nr:hypothetical protein FRX31_001987 [Thalictrum thalictroides]